MPKSSSSKLCSAEGDKCIGVDKDGKGQIAFNVYYLRERSRGDLLVMCLAKIIYMYIGMPCDRD